MNGAVAGGLGRRAEQRRQRGKAGPYVGDVHPAVQLAKLVPTEPGDPQPWFVDLSRPISDAFGRNAFADIAKRNMEFFEGASRAFAGSARKAAAASSPSAGRR